MIRICLTGINIQFKQLFFLFPAVFLCMSNNRHIHIDDKRPEAGYALRKSLCDAQSCTVRVHANTIRSHHVVLEWVHLFRGQDATIIVAFERRNRAATETQCSRLSQDWLCRENLNERLVSPRGVEWGLGQRKARGCTEWFIFPQTSLLQDVLWIPQMFGCNEKAQLGLAWVQFGLWMVPFKALLNHTVPRTSAANPH